MTLRNTDGTIILQTSGIEKVYDPKQAKTVNPFLAYSPNGTVASVRTIVIDLDQSNYEICSHSRQSFITPIMVD